MLIYQLENLLKVIFRNTLISRLELTLHEKAAEGGFDHEFVNAQWTHLYQDLCDSAIEILPEHQYDWAHISHLFFKPFSCYQYTASALASLACYQQYRDLGQAFVPGYLDLLGSGSSEHQVDALRNYVGVDLENPDTIEKALSYVEGLFQQLSGHQIRTNK